MISHISAPFGLGVGEVFVWDDIKSGVDWERIQYEEALQSGRHIIKCALCDEPAVRLDHYFAYFSGQNRCKAHIGKEREGWLGVAKGARGKAHYIVGYRSLCYRWECEGGRLRAEIDVPKCKECERRLAIRRKIETAREMELARWQKREKLPKAEAAKGEINGSSS